MSHRNVLLEDTYGDRVIAVEHPPHMSDEPGTYTVNTTTWYTTVWQSKGWKVISTGEWQE